MQLLASLSKAQQFAEVIYVETYINLQIIQVPV